MTTTSIPGPTIVMWLRGSKLAEVPPSIFSEIAADVQTFAAPGEYAEDWARKVW